MRSAISVALLLLCGIAMPGHSASFIATFYDAPSDELVVILAYRGTNPGRTFSLAWGDCRRSPVEGGFEISARVLDVLVT